MINIICNAKDCKHNFNQYCIRKETLYISKKRVCQEYSKSSKPQGSSKSKDKDKKLPKGESFSGTYE